MAKEANVTIIEPTFRGSVKKMENPSSRLSELLVSQNFYTGREGEVYTFDPENVEYREATPAGATNPCVLVMCQVKRGNGDAKQSWFNLNSLKKRDAHQNYVYPIFEEMDAAQIMDWLFEHKTLTVSGMKEIQVPAFEGGRPKTDVVEINGELVNKTVVRSQKVPVYTEINA